MTIVMFKSYPTAEQASRVEQALLDAGFAPKHVCVVSSSTLMQDEDGSPDTWPFVYDRNRERQGSFADTEAALHDRNLERRGSFADADPALSDRNRERQGSFADVAPTLHDRNVERKGSFADMETPAGEADALVAALRRAGLSQDDAAREAAAVRAGATLILVRTPSGSVAAAADVLGKGSAANP